MVVVVLTTLLQVQWCKHHCLKQCQSSLLRTPKSSMDLFRAFQSAAIKLMGC